MKVDFLDRKDINGTGSNSLSPKAKQARDEQEMAKYQQMKSQFIKKHDEVGQKLVKNYHDDLQEEAERRRNLTRNSQLSNRSTKSKISNILQKMENPD